MRIVLSLIFLLLLVECAGPIKEFYNDSYFTEDHIYENKSIRFSLTFRNNWEIETNPNNLDKGVQKEVRRLQKQGVELLFAGATTDNLHGVSGFAVNLNESTQKYAEIIREKNKDNLTADSGLVDLLIKDKPVVKWEFSKLGLQYVEFFFTIDTYNIRVAFWSEPEIYRRFLPVYLSIISSLDYLY